MELGDVSALTTAWHVIRALFIVLDVTLVIAFVVVFPKAWKFRPKLALPAPTEKRVLTLSRALYQEQWQRIVQKLGDASPDALRVAVIEADSFADHSLRDVGIEGESMGERLMRVRPSEMKHLNRVWKAHRFRNDLVHTPNMTVTPDDARLALRDYELFLKELGVL